MVVLSGIIALASGIYLSSLFLQIVGVILICSPVIILAIGAIALMIVNKVK
jgi:hypothetical protein